MNSRETKRAVAKELILTAGHMIENWEDIFAGRGEVPPCTAEEAREMVSGWLFDLPGSFWDIRLDALDD